MSHILGLICYGLILLYGIVMSLCFCDVAWNRKSAITAGCFFFFALLLQSTCWWLLGIETTKRLYPFIIHLPLTIFLAKGCKCSWLVSLSSVFSGYLCCQIPRWMGTVGAYIVPIAGSYYFWYIVTMALSFWWLVRFVTVPVNHLITQSWKACLLFGAVPFFYYLFDYATTVYTDWLYSGMKAAVQFMPSVVSMFYFVFVVIYYGEAQKQEAAQRECNLAAAQLKQAETEISAFRQMQANTLAYRHDMRHHFTLLQQMTAEGSIEKIQDYLRTAQSDLDNITPIRYCANETVNLILSAFTARAKQANVTLDIEANLPEKLPINDTELCSLLSNGLENAIKAAAETAPATRSRITFQATVHRAHLLILIRNPYNGEIVTKDGLPQSTQGDHGYGTKSMAMIVEKHNGVLSFDTADRVFTLKVMLPITA